MYRCKAWRLSAKSLMKVSVRDSDVVGIAQFPPLIYPTPPMGSAATLAIRMGGFGCSSVVCATDRSDHNGGSGARRSVLAGEECGNVIVQKLTVGRRDGRSRRMPPERGNGRKRAMDDELGLVASVR